MEQLEYRSAWKRTGLGMNMHTSIAIAIFVTTVIAVILYGLLFNMYSRSGVRHLKRHYLSCFVSVSFATFCVLVLNGDALPSLLAALPVGCLLAWRFFLHYEDWLDRHINGSVIWCDAVNKKRWFAQVVLTCALTILGTELRPLWVPFIFYVLTALLSFCVGWLGSSILSIRVLLKEESFLGRPILEQERGARAA
jgi:hypothetical protein